MTLSDQAATGSADREAVAIALGWEKNIEEFHRSAASAVYDHVTWSRGGDRLIWDKPPDYQRDLAATLAEIERRGWHWSGGSYEVFRFRVETDPTGYDRPEHRATGTTIANAAIAALLKALEAKP